MLTIACVWIKANVPYPVEYVANLRSMVARHLSRSHRFVCFTDRPEQVPMGVEPIAVSHPKNLAGWWAKLNLFTPGVLPFGSRVLYLDLDTLIVDALDPIVDFPAPFALIPHAGTFNGKDGKAVVKRFNSSVMVWQAGYNTNLYLDFDKSVSDRLHGDQDWIGEQMPDASMFPIEWFPRLSELRGQKPTPPAKVVLAKVPKNHIAADLYPWFGKTWRAA